jgi:hypothetical protein
MFRVWPPWIFLTGPFNRLRTTLQNSRRSVQAATFGDAILRVCGEWKLWPSSSVRPPLSTPSLPQHPTQDNLYAARGPATEERRQNLTRIARLIRFSIFFRSGVKPGTNAPGDPHIFSTIGGVGQVGVTPPGPEKYGTFAAR